MAGYDDIDPRCPPPTTPDGLLGSIVAQSNRPKQSRKPEVSYFISYPENQIVLSERLKALCEDVGGCQTEKVKVVIRRVIYELVHQKL